MYTVASIKIRKKYSHWWSNLAQG